MRNLFLSGFFILLLATCSGTKNQKKSDVSSDEVNITCPTFTFGTGPCFGYCPIFEISIDSSGIAQLIGKRFTYPSGTFQDTLSSSQIKKLYGLVNTIDWDTVPERYESRVADAQSYFFTSGDSVSTTGTFDMPASFDSLRMFFFELEKELSWMPMENEDYEKILQNDGAFVRFLEKMDVNMLRKQHPFLQESKFTQIDESIHLYMVNTYNSNLDYEGLKHHLVKLEMVDSVEPIYQLKKKLAIIRGSLEK